MERSKYYNYIKKLEKIKIVIMGKDPFPKDATQIPFCKPDWEKQNKKNSSGYIVLKALGIKPDDEQLNYNTPQDLFFDLANKGVVFLNLIYERVGRQIRKHQDGEKLYEGFKINKPILEKAYKIILCGEAKKNKWNNYKNKNIVEVPHPDIRNKHNQHIKEDWINIWEKGELFKDILEE